jgi:hypothetical protein
MLLLLFRGAFLSPRHGVSLGCGWRNGLHLGRFTYSRSQGISKIQIGCTVLSLQEVRQTEIHTTEPLVPEPRFFEAELATEELKVTNQQVMIKSQQNLLRQGVVRFVMRSINLLFLFGIRRNCLWSRSRSLLLNSLRNGHIETCTSSSVHIRL